MMFVLSAQDIQKLSPESRAEIMKLLAGDFGLPSQIFAGEFQLDGRTESEEVINDEKQVLSLTVEEAGDLLANISERSRQTLLHFASGKPVPLDALVGPDKPYKNYVELKRSFVGAVNRRLRTVSSNRHAALFTSDREQTLIKVKPQTAKSLRRVFAISDPLPAMRYCDQSGNALEATEMICQKLHKKLESTWEKLDTKSLPESSIEAFAMVMKHFVANGFELQMCNEAWDLDSDISRYEIHSPKDPNLVIESYRNEPMVEELFLCLPGDRNVMAQPVIL